MPTTWTPRLNLTNPARSQRDWNTLLDANRAALDGLAGTGLLAAAAGLLDASGNPSGLTVRVNAGAFLKADGTAGAATTQTVTVPPSATTRVWLTEAGAAAAGSAWPAGNYVPVATVTAGAANLTAVLDSRVMARALAPAPLFLPVAGGQLADGADVAVGTTAGTRIGTAPAQRLAFFGNTGVPQPADAGQAALTDSTGGDTSAAVLAALATLAALTDGSGGTAGTIAAISDPATANAVATLTARVNALSAQNATVNTNLARTARLLNGVRAALVTLGLIKGSA